MEGGSLSPDVRTPDLFDLHGRSAVVTGGSGHLGSALVEALAEQGADVAVTSRSEARCQRVVDRVRKRGVDGELVALAMDVSDEAAVRSGIDAVQERFGRLDILVNNAYYGDHAPLDDQSVEQWRSSIDGGLTSAFRCTKHAVPVMRSGDGGAIVNVASMYGIVSPDPEIYRDDDEIANPASYGAAKAGLIQLTRYLACHLAPDGIRVNAISPGPFPKEEVQETEWFVEELEAKNPMGRIGQPSELKGAVAYLASDASSYVTGHNLVVDGGWTTW